MMRQIDDQVTLRDRTLNRSFARSKDADFSTFAKKREEGDLSGTIFPRGGSIPSHRSDWITMSRLTSLPHRLLSDLRKWGLRKTIAMAFKDYLFSYQRRYLLIRELTGQHSPLPKSDDIEIRLISADDVNRFQDFFGRFSAEEFRHCISRGDHIFVAFAHGEPMAFRHISAISRIYLPFRHFPLQPGQLWVVDISTIPAYRGKRVASLLREYAEWYLTGQGYKEIVSTIESKNIASLHHARRVSYSHIQLFTYIRILFFSHIWMHRDSNKKFYSS